MERSNNTQKISPERAVKMLAEHGEIITIKEAKIVLEFMYDLASLAIDQYMRNENGRFIYPGENE